MIVVIVTARFGINYISSSKLDNALDACNTIVALIVGFLGAILPVIMGMKNESKLVKYVFEKDKDRLFLKYMKATIFTGLLTLLITVSLYFSEDFSKSAIAYYEFYVWEALFVCFMLLTYRSLKNILDIIFSPDVDMGADRYYKSEEQKAEEKKIQDEFAE